jgi:hypothetical protein
LNYRQSVVGFSYLFSLVVGTLCGSLRADISVDVSTRARAQTTAALQRLRDIAGPHYHLRENQLAVAEHLFFEYYSLKSESQIENQDHSPWVAWVVLEKGPDNGIFADLLTQTLAQNSKTASHISMSSDAGVGFAELNSAGSGKQLVVIDGLSTVYSLGESKVEGNNTTAVAEFQRSMANIVGLLLNQKVPNRVLVLVEDSDLLQYIDVPLYRRINALIDGTVHCASHLQERFTFQ